MVTAHLNFTQPSKRIFTKSIWMGAALLLCASGSYAQNWNPAPTAESTAYSSYPAAKTPQKNYAVFAEYANFEADFDSGDTVELDGFALGVSTTPHRSGFYGRLEFLKNNEYDLDYYEFNMGGNLNLISYHGFYLNTYAGLSGG